MKEYVVNYVYLLVSEEGETYVGCTSDLRRRVSEHKQGHSRSTRNRQWHLVYYEAYLCKEDATKREWRLKQDGRAKRWLLQRAEKSMQQVCGLK
jgi:putative endonuclease